MRTGEALSSPLESTSRAALAGARIGSRSAGSIATEPGQHAVSAFGASSQYTLR